MHVLVGKVWSPWRHVCKTYRGIRCQREGHLNKFKRRRKDMWALLYIWWLVTMKSNSGRTKCSTLRFACCRFFVSLRYFVPSSSRLGAGTCVCRFRFVTPLVVSSFPFAHLTAQAWEREKV